MTARVVCAWCEFVIEPGCDPASHGACVPCQRKLVAQLDGVLAFCPWCPDAERSRVECESRGLRPYELHCEHHAQVKRRLEASRRYRPDWMRRHFGRKPSPPPTPKRGARSDRWLSTEPMRRWNRLAERRCCRDRRTRRKVRGLMGRAL